MPSWLQKVVHALAPAAGAAGVTAVDAVSRGTFDARTVAVGALGAFLGYLFKRPRVVAPAK